jgi:hypothetical protein
MTTDTDKVETILRRHWQIPSDLSPAVFQDLAFRIQVLIGQKYSHDNLKYQLSLIQTKELKQNFDDPACEQIASDLRAIPFAATKPAWSSNLTWKMDYWNTNSRSGSMSIFRRAFAVPVRETMKFAASCHHRTISKSRVTASKAPGSGTTALSPKAIWPSSKSLRQRPNSAAGSNLAIHGAFGFTDWWQCEPAAPLAMTEVINKPAAGRPLEKIAGLYLDLAK